MARQRQILACSFFQKDAGGSRTHFDRVAADCRAVWLQRQSARSAERAMFHSLSLKVVIAVDAIKSGLTSGSSS